MQKRHTLNKRQELFCHYLVDGNSQAQSYLKAGFKANTIQQAGSNAVRLLKTERVSSYLSKLKDIKFTKDALSFAEKRAYLARAVRCDASNPDPDLVQEMREEVDAQGNIKRTRKIVSKIDAIRVDNNMAGDNFAYKHQASENPFLLLVTLSQADAHKSIQGESTRALPAQDHGEVIDVEATPAE